jgi:alpha-L-rhamnosidase
MCFMEDKIEWQAGWIWKTHTAVKNSFAYFRKEIDIPGDFCSARVFVSAHNHFKLFINGKAAGGYVTPAPTDPQKSKYYLVYDVTEMLVPGMNALCAAAHYLGGEGQNYVNGQPGFILQCEVTGADGTVLLAAATDESWKVLCDTPYMDRTEYQQNRRISAIEIYDASREPEGWLHPGFDDSCWENAVYSPAADEKWEMKLQQIPEGVIEEIIVPRPVGVQMPGLQVFDAGKIISGWPLLELKGIQGTAVRMRYSENLDEGGNVGHNVANENSENYYDEYIMAGSGIESWSPDFSYKAFRYVEITGFPEMVSPEQVKIISAHTGIEYRGSFHCSNPLLNEIYEACIQTQKNNVLGQLVDCPHREQAQYLADSDMQAETLCYSFVAKSVLEKVLNDFRDAQQEDGTFSFVFPSNFKNPDFYIMIPEWDLHFCTLMWKIYRTYGDKAVLRDNFAAAKRMLEFYQGLTDEKTGLIPKCEGRWHISDWPYPDIDHSGRFLTVQNCKVFHVLELMSETADVLEFDRDSRFFGEKADKLKTAIVKHLYNKETGRFADCYGSSESHLGTNVAAYRYGLVPESGKAELLEYIASAGMGCKTLLALNLFQILFENGRGEQAYKLLNSTEYPGWGYMIGKGAKTIWEGFDDIESHCHAWNAYPARLLGEYILGVKAVKAGFEEIEIKPYIDDSMDYAEGRIFTVHGDISVRWEKNPGALKVTIGIPDGIRANVVLPEKYKAEVTYI